MKICRFLDCPFCQMSILCRLSSEKKLSIFTVFHEKLGSAHDLFQFLNLLDLLVNEQLGVAHDVDEQNVANLEFEVRRL